MLLLSCKGEKNYHNSSAAYWGTCITLPSLNRPKEIALKKNTIFVFDQDALLPSFFALSFPELSTLPNYFWQLAIKICHLFDSSKASMCRLTENSYRFQLTTTGESGHQNDDLIATINYDAIIIHIFGVKDLFAPRISIHLMAGITELHYLDLMKISRWWCWLALFFPHPRRVNQVQLIT